MRIPGKSARPCLNLDLLVVTDLYLTPTAELADIVLPAASWLEVNLVRGYPCARKMSSWFSKKSPRSVRPGRIKRS